MKKCLIAGMAVLLLAAACRREVPSPRPTIHLVHEIAADSSGLASIASKAGSCGAKGSIAIIGEPSDVIALARRFHSIDEVDNIDGSPVRDSLPDFAGEVFDAILDAYSAPYPHFVHGSSVSTDSLRESAVRCAMSAWDSLCFRSSADQLPILGKQQAKMLIYTSSLNSEYGLFDVDTLQQLTGGASRILSAVDVMLDDALQPGDVNIAVWTGREVCDSKAWEHAFAARDASIHASISVLSPEKAFDIRTELRNLLRLYQGSGRSLDVIILDRFGTSCAPLESEIQMIRRGATEEDAAFARMLSPDFRIITPEESITRATYGILRSGRLFSHRIALPQVRYYETSEGVQGSQVLVEVTGPYVQSTYVPDFN